MPMAAPPGLRSMRCPMKRATCVSRLDELTWFPLRGWSRMLLAGPTDERRQGLNMEGVAETRKKRILVVDDHALVRAGFRELIDDTEDLVVSGEAGTAASALGQGMGQDFGGVVLDISLAGASVVWSGTRVRRGGAE